MADSPRLEELRRRVQADPASIAFAALAEEYRRAGKFREAVEASRAVTGGGTDWTLVATRTGLLAGLLVAATALATRAFAAYQQSL